MFNLSKNRLGMLLSGSVLLFVSTTIVNLGNYLFNLLLGRWLGPAAFADLSLLITLMLVVTLVTVTVQTVVAKFSALFVAQAQEDKLAALRRWGMRWAWGVGLLIAAGMVFGSVPLQHFFQTESAWPFVLLGIGIPLYFAQGVDRGLLQGQVRFLPLALSYQAEMLVRLILGLAAVALGLSVSGAVAAITASFAATWAVAGHATRRFARFAQLDQETRQQAERFAIPVLLALVGQILINNSDVLIVKRFFAAEAAGQYAALALIGRIVFFATWSIVTVLLPIVVQRHQRGEAHTPILWLALGSVAIISIGVIGVSFFFPEAIILTLFGAAYLPIAPLLWLYAIATAMFGLANVVITYQLALNDSSGSIIAMGTGILQVIVLGMVHTSLQQVVVLQIGLMGGLLSVLAITQLWRWLRQKTTPVQTNHALQGSIG